MYFSQLLGLSEGPNFAPAAQILPNWSGNLENEFATQYGSGSAKICSALPFLDCGEERLGVPEHLVNGHLVGGAKLLLEVLLALVPQQALQRQDVLDVGPVQLRHEGQVVEVQAGRHLLGRPEGEHPDQVPVRAEHFALVLE